MSVLAKLANTKLARETGFGHFMHDSYQFLTQSYRYLFTYKYSRWGLGNRIELVYKELYRITKKYPYNIGVEISSTCPLNCEFCILKELKTYKKRKKIHMGFKEFKHIVNELSGFCNLLQLSGGEPILNNDIFRMLKYARSRNMPVLLASNAVLLTKEKSDKLLDNPPFGILIPYESPDKKTYEKIRKNAKYDTFMDNIKYLISEKKRRKQFYPIITLQMVLTKQNMKQKDTYHKSVTELGADYSSIKALGVWPEGSKSYKKKMEEHYVIDKRKTRISRHELDKNGKLKDVQIKKGMCPGTQMLYIGSGGEILPCFYVVANAVSQGNVLESNFKTIWDSNSYKKFRKKMYNGKAYKNYCNQCIGIGAVSELQKVKLMDGETE